MKTSWLDSLEKAEVLLEAAQLWRVTDKLDLILSYYPDFINLKHCEMAFFMGVTRESVTRACNSKGLRRQIRKGGTNGKQKL
jgi:hypothetical protein